MTLSIEDTQHKRHSASQQYVISAIALIVIMLSVITLSVIMLSVIMLSVLAPLFQL